MVLKPDARKLVLAGAALLAALIGTLYYRSAGLGYIYSYDDGYNIFVNPHMGPPTWKRLAWCLTNWDYTRRYMPLGWMGISAIYPAAHLNVAPYHWVSIFWLAASATALLLAVLNAIRVFSPNAADGLTKSQVACALAATAWWAFHPLRVETTTWVSGMLYGQSGFFAFLAVASHLRGLVSLDRNEGRAQWIAITFTLYVFSLGSYPIALGLPPALFAADWLYVRRRTTRDRSKVPLPRPQFWKTAWPSLVLVMPAIAATWMTVFAKAHADAAKWGTLPTLVQDPISHKIAKAVYTLTYYGWRPWQPVHLSLIYETLFHPDLTQPAFIACLVVVLLAATAAFSLWRKRPAVTAAAAAYVALTLPFAGITEGSQITCDRYAHLNQALMAIVIGVVLASLTPKALKISAAFILIFTTAFSVETWQRQLAWKSTQTLFLDAATSLHTKESVSWAVWRLNQNDVAVKDKVAVEIAMSVSLTQDGDLDAANDHLTEALKIKDHGWRPEFNKALLLLYLPDLPDHVRQSMKFYADSKADGNTDLSKKRNYLTNLAGVASREGLSDVLIEAQKETDELATVKTPVPST